MSESTTTKPAKKLAENEIIKANSHLLRGTIVESLRNPITASVADADNALLKFHGTYMQDNRDIREERARQRLEPAYDFMIRIRAPGGVITSKQWLELDHLAHKYAGSQMRITTRQSLQFHGVTKWELRQTMHDINQTLLTTLAACGDINRNVMCSPNPHQSEVHAQAFEISRQISDHLFPKTQAYHEIWLANEKAYDSRNGSAALNGNGSNGNGVNSNGTGHAPAKIIPGEDEPIYGPTYLPRKFKIAIAVPPTNDVDVFAHDIGFIAIIENNKLVGFNVSAGGGMGCTHGDTATYPNLGTVIGFCKPDQAVNVSEKILTTQRDFGDRTNRKHARMKYTIADRGIEWFTDEVNRRLGWKLQPAKAYKFEHHGDRYGWIEGYNGLWHLNIYIEDGRVKDWDDYKLMSGLKAIAEEHAGEYRLTPNENLIIANIPPSKRARIEELIAEYKIHVGTDISAVRRSSMACVAFPTCGLAMAESERYLPSFISKIEPILKEFGIADEPIAIRITGCPNGCARPFLGEIGLVGVSLGKYNLYLGADATGERLNRLYKGNIGEEEILAILKPMIGRWAKERKPAERFGDFVVRVGIVRAVAGGSDFHS